MTKNLSTSNNGDTTAPALRATEGALRLSADQASKIQAEKSRSSSASSSLVNFSAALKSTDLGRGNVKTCNRTLWVSFFFDGTRNNMLADLALSKHSNIVRLYRAHKKTDLGSDRFVLYIPGIGTYFPEIGDKGGGAWDLVAGEKERVDLILQLNNWIFF